MPETASEKILTVLGRTGLWLAVHELEDYGLRGVSQNSAAARLRELRSQGRVECRKREEKNFKEWRFVSKDQLPLFQENA